MRLQVVFISFKVLFENNSVISKNKNNLKKLMSCEIQ